MKRIIPLLLLLLSSTLHGQITIEKKLVVEGVTDPVFVGSTLVLPAESKLVVKEAVKVSVDSTFKFNDILVKKDGVSVPVSGTELLFSDPGTYEVNVVLFDPEKGIKRGAEIIKLGGTPNPPPGPTPTPTPTPSDEKVDNLSVLVIYESQDLPKYTISQRSVIQSTDLQVYMNKTLPRDTNNQPLWRVLDKDVTFPATCDTTFCKWMSTLDKSKLPMLVLGNKDKIVYQGPLPEDVEVVKSLITKHKK
jgi:hypothetical protein